MGTPKRCLECGHWNHQKVACDRIFKVKLLIAYGGGDLDIHTTPGLIPEHLESEFQNWLVDAITAAVDSYPGWKEVLEARAKGGCAAEKPSGAIKEFGRRLSLAKPLPTGEADPLKNLDSHGLFKSDISPW